MRAISNALVVVLSGALFGVRSVAPASAAEPVQSVVTPLPSAVPCYPNWIQIYHFTKQPVDHWRARINGSDLPKLVGNSGFVDYTISDRDGTEEGSKPWDRNTPFSAFVTFNGPLVTVAVNVYNQQRTKLGCTYIFRLSYS